ncbi:MAG: FtsX-like permease family protein [Bdellovibrionales bacterium]|nr:FtsX-like permease family protein [Bdellovibrionales bacterium]
MMARKPNPVSILAKGFLLSKTSDGFLSLISWVSVVGVALGVLALTVVTSVINGFEGELGEAISGLNGDVVLYSRADPVADPATIEKKILRTLPQAKAVSASLITELMAAGPKGTGGVVLEGVDPAAAAKATTLPKRIVQGRMPEKDGEIVMAKVLAEKTGAVVGGTIRLVIPQIASAGSEGESRGMGVPKIVEADVVGIASLGMYEYDSKYAFSKIGWSQSIFHLPNRASTFKIKLPRGDDSRAASDRLSESFGYPFRAKDWTQLNKNLFYAIKLEKVVIAIILLAIVIVAAFNVVSTLMMMIHDKTKEIAILKAMGLTPAQGFRIFAWIGLGIGLVGTAAGMGFGLLLNVIIDKTKLIRLPADVYYIDYLPVTINWNEIALIGGLAVGIILLATFYPAVRVSTQSPMEGIRYD